MKKLIVALLSAAGIALGSASAADSSNAAKGEKKEAVTEALVRQRVEDWAKAIRAKDIDGVMSLYAPNIVSFDIDIEDQLQKHEARLAKLETASA